MKVKSILVTQPKPEGEKSPYFDLAKKFNIKIDFRPFIQVEGIPAQDFRKTKINILEHDAVIFTSKNAVDHFFRVCADLRITVPDTMKYFCVTESIAYYLQKYVVYRKRKIFFGKQTFNDLMDTIKKHKDDNYLFPCAEESQQTIPDILTKNKIKFTEAVLYRTVSSPLKDLDLALYDMLVFFSPADIRSLFENFPKFKQKDIRIATFGSTTNKAALDESLKIEIAAPTPEAPSMTMALEQYVVKANK